MRTTRLLHRTITRIWLLVMIISITPFSGAVQATGSNLSSSSDLSLALAADPLLLFSDNFDRANNTTIGNGWVEVSLKDAQASLQSNRLCFTDTSERNMRPIVRHSFQQVASGLLIWDFDFDWQMIASEPVYQLALQLGQGNLMSDSNFDNGIGVNLVWMNSGGVPETLGYRKNKAFTPISQVSGAQHFTIQADLDARTYQLSLNGALVRSEIPFDKAVSLDTVRIFADKLNEVNFSGRCFDNLQIQQGAPPPVPPVITSTAVTTGIAGQAYAYDVDASGTPTPTYSLATSPSGMAIDSTIGLISWTPTTEGDYPVTVVAGNTAGSASQSFSITVGPAPSPPAITSSPMTLGTAGQAYAYDVDASGIPAPSFSLATSPSGMTIDSTSGLISWTPSTSGDFFVTVVASNTAGSASQSFTISVETAPSTPVITSVPVTQATEGQAYAYDVDASGYPDPVFSLSVSPEGMVINTSTGLINWTPSNSGDYPVAVVASNSVGENSQSFTILVQTAPSPPVITSIPATLATVGQAYAYDVDASGYPAPTFSLTDSPAGMSIDPASGLVSWTPSSNGDFPVTVTASNLAGSDSQSFTITAGQLPSPPEINSTPVTQGTVGQAYTYDVDASGYPAPTFSLAAFPEGMTIDSTTGQINWMPSSQGNFDVTILASNTAGSDSQSFTISVQPAPSLPLITSTPITVATVGQSYSYDVEASGDPAPSFSLGTSPAGMVIDTTTGMIQWTPAESGDFPVTIMATNPAGSDSQSFTIIASQPLSPPTITSIPTTQATAGQAYAYDVEATGNPAPTFSLTTSPLEMSIDFTSGLIAWTPSASGDFPVTVTAENTMGSASQEFILSVLPAGEASWSMAGANPERTSWIPEEVRGELSPLWYRPIEPYIIPKTQIVTAYGNLYISTARGLYSLDASTGAVEWVFPTELPLGHSPTIDNGTVYVGGLDHKIYAIDAQTGAGLWTFTAGGGFSTNPLVVSGKVFAGSRDGYFYAVHASGPQSGQLAWKFRTGGPVLYSAAYKDGVVYFASNDSHAYALNIQNGDLVWKSEKLGGAGFHSWWPVVYGDWIIFAGSSNYRTNISPGPSNLRNLDLWEVYPNYKKDPRGTLVGPLGAEPGDWAAGTPTINTSLPTVTSYGSTLPITQYFESKPWRRTYFVLNRGTGQEATFDFDGDNKPEYAPILWFGTYTGNRFPPVIGSDGVLYQANNYRSDPSIAGGHISGWKFGTPFISIINAGWNAVDEPVYYAAGGDLIYWGRCCDRVAGSMDIRQPAIFPDPFRENSHRSWGYFSYDLESRIPGYSAMTYLGAQLYAPQANAYGTRNGSYNFHGDGNPPIPYQGKVFMHRSNAVIAFAPGTNTPVHLPTALTVPVENSGIPAPSTEELNAALEVQVQKILAAGHLRPGYSSTGMLDFSIQRGCGDFMGDYFHYPGETIETLIRALPHLSPDLQEQTKTYLQSEFNTYLPYKYAHIGWNTGAARELFILPPEVEADRANFSAKTIVYNFAGWSFPPHSFYAIWKYAEVFGNAKALFDASKSKLVSVPADTVLAEMPHVHNAFIAGYWGYLELEKLAGYPESTTIRSQLNRLLELRASTFTKNTADSFFTTIQKQNCRSLNSSRNFIYMVPELAQYLHDHALSKVQEAMDEYMWVNPFWFVTRPEATFGEGVINHLYEPHGMFQAKALVLKEPRDELAKFLDVPAFEVGDLYYIDNLIRMIESP